MTVGLNVVAFAVAAVVAMAAFIWAVGAQGTIDFTRDADTLAAAQREQGRALLVGCVSAVVAALIFFATMAPPITFVLIQ